MVVSSVSGVVRCTLDIDNPTFEANNPELKFSEATNLTLVPGTDVVHSLESLQDRSLPLDGAKRQFVFERERLIPFNSLGSLASGITDTYRVGHRQLSCMVALLYPFTQRVINFEFSLPRSITPHSFQEFRSQQCSGFGHKSRFGVIKREALHATAEQFPEKRKDLQVSGVNVLPSIAPSGDLDLGRMITLWHVVHQLVEIYKWKCCCLFVQTKLP